MLFVLLLNENVDNKKKRLFYTIGLVAAMTYAMTLHSRAVTFWIAALVLVGYYFWTYRKWLVSPLFFTVAGAAGYWLAKKGVSHMVAVVLNGGAAEEIGNTTVSFSMRSILESVKSLTGFVYIMLGQINTMFVFATGLAMFAVIVGIIFLWKALLRKPELFQEAERKESSNYVVVAVFCLAAVAVTIIGNSFSWLGGITSMLETGESNDAVRALTYLRYYAAYFGPIMMIGLTYSYKKKDAFQKLFPYVLGCVILIEGFWTVCILPYVANCGGTISEYAPFSFTDSWTDKIGLRTYLPGMALVFVMLFIFYWCYKKRRLNLVVGILCCFLLYEYAYTALITEGKRGEINYTYVDDIYGVLHPLDAKGELPQELYVQKSTTVETYQSTNYQYQFYFKNHKIVQGLPPREADEAVFLTSFFMEYPELVEEGYLCAQLDDLEYIHVKGERLQKLIREQGVDLKPYMQNTSSAPLKMIMSDVRQGEPNVDFMESNGQEGKFAYGYKVPFSGGEVEVSLEMELLENTQGKIGTVELWKNGINNCIYSKEIYRKDFDENGKLKVVMKSMCNATEKLEPVIYLTDGSRVRLKSCKFSKLSNHYDVGVESKEDSKELLDIIQMIDSNAKISYVHSYKNCDLSLEYLNSIANGQKITEMAYEKDMQLEGKERFVIIPNDGMFVFNLSEHFTVIAKTDSYTLLVPKESELEKRAEAKNMILSGKDGVKKEYFEAIEEDGLISDEAAFSINAGDYSVKVVADVERIYSSKNGRFRIRKGDETLAECEVKADSANKKRMTGTIEIGDYEHFYGLQCELFLPQGVKSTATEVYIQRK